MTPPGDRVDITVTAATFTGNRGAEAMLRATLAGLRERLPSPTFHVFSYYPAEDRRVARDPDVEVHSLTPLALVFRLVPLTAAYALFRWLGLRLLLRHFPRDVQSVAASRVLVDLAGVSFVEGREAYLPFNVLSLAPGLILGVPVVKLSQAMGPFRRPLNRTVARAVLARCRALFARGGSTLEHLGGLGLGDRVRSAPDLAFLLEPQRGGGVEEVIGVIEARRPGVRSVVGVCPSSLLAERVGAAYEDLVADVVVGLVRAGDLVVLFPHASRGSPEAGPRNNDLYVIRALLERLPDEVADRVLAVERDLPAREILALLTAVDLAVVSRFHAMVGALSLGRPAVVVGWSHKYAEVMADFGLGAHVFDGRDARAAEVLASADALRAYGGELGRRIEARARELRRGAAAQLDFVAGIPRRGVASPTPASPSSGRGRRLRAASQVVWMALVAVFTVRFVLRHGHELAALEVAADPATWWVAFGWILAAKVAISLMVWEAWRAAGAEMGVGAAVYAYNLSQLPKYLPGGVWPYLTRVRMARTRSVALPRIGGGLALETAFLLGGAAVLAALTVDGSPLPERAGGDAWVGVLRGGVLALLALAWGAVLRASTRRRSVLAATGLALVAWLFLGLSFHRVVAGLSSAPPGPEVAGLFALAWGVGFVAVFSPAGLGVREAILGVGLASSGAPAAVAAMVVGHRLLYVAADVTCALCARLVIPPERRG